MKKYVFAVLPVLAAGIWFGFGRDKKPATAEIPDMRMTIELAQIRQFIAENPKYNPNIVFLADMKMLSAKHRFFVYDLKENTIIDRGLVAHGSGSETGIYGKLKFSDVPNSLCTSLGKYEIGKSYHGKFGKAYKLYGLDKTNANAFQRNIVLHKFDALPTDEQDAPIRTSHGCPMVSVKFYERLQKHIDASAKPILLHIYK